MQDRSERSEDETSEGTDIKPTSHTSSVWKVLGELADAGATGVLGHNTATSGAGTGVEGVTDSSGAGSAGVEGKATAGSGTTYGVAGYNDSTQFSAAVYGEVTASSNTNKTNGVYGYDPTENGAGVFGEAGGPGTTYGVYGEDLTADGYGVYSNGDSKTSGNDEVTGHRSTGMVGVDAYLETDATVQHDTRTTVPFDQTRRDDFTGMNQSSTGKYTVQVAGDYHVDFAISWADFFSGDQVDYALLAPGYEFIEDVQHNSNESIGFSKTVFDMDVGDDIYVEVEQFSGGPMDIDGTGRGDTYMTIHKVG